MKIFKSCCMTLLLLSGSASLVSISQANEAGGDKQSEQVSPQSEESGQSADEQKGEYVFDIWEIQVKGNTLLETKLIERTVYPFLGPGKTIQDIDAAREALEIFYRDSGYPTILVDIPQQDVSDGVVSLLVTEGKVSRVRVSGSRYFSLKRIKSKIPALAEGSVPNIPKVQSQLQELNQDSQDRVVTPIFRPGRSPGTVEVELRVKDELPVHGDVELNNRYSRDTSELRMSASLRYANLWQREHSASLLYMVSPGALNQVKVFSGTYVAPVGDNVIAAYLVDSKSDVATAGDLAVLGDGLIIGGRYILPMHASSEYLQNFTLGVDYKDFDENTVLLGSDTLNTPINYTNFMAQYSGTLLGQKSTTRFDIGTNFGLRGLGNKEQEFENKRFQSKPNYFYLTGNIEYRRQVLASGEFVASVSGQLADSALISNEQFSAGGADGVRGYFESQALGDDGVSGSVELYSPSYAAKINDNVKDLRLLAFADVAKLRIKDPLPDNAQRYELYSAGIGLRMSAFDNLDLTLDWAWPLVDAVQVRKGDSRGHFSLKYGF